MERYISPVNVNGDFLDHKTRVIAAVKRGKQESCLFVKLQCNADVTAARGTPVARYDRSLFFNHPFTSIHKAFVVIHYVQEVEATED